MWQLLCSPSIELILLVNDKKNVGRKILNSVNLKNPQYGCTDSTFTDVTPVTLSCTNQYFAVICIVLYNPITAK